MTLVSTYGVYTMPKASSNQINKKISSIYDAHNGRSQFRSVNILMKCMFMYNLGETSMQSYMFMVIQGDSLVE